jgi:hypothetical protein
MVSSRSLWPVLEELRGKLRQNLAVERELTGWNSAALGYVQRELIEAGVVGFGGEDVSGETAAKKRTFPTIS